MFHLHLSCCLNVFCVTDGIPFQGMELRMKRPDKFQGNPTPSVTWREFMELRSNVEKGLSSVVMVAGAIRESELDDDESFRAVTDDMKVHNHNHNLNMFDISYSPCSSFT